MFVRAIGMTCPTGLSWRAACAAMRAGISRRGELPWRDNDGQPIVGSRLDRLDHLLSPRWLQLLAWSLAEALAPIDRAHRGDLPVLLVIPQEERALALRSAFDDLWDALGLSSPRIQVSPGGPEAGLRALAVAREALAHQPQCLVGAADSLIGARPLLRLSEQRRLLAPENPDGVIPGEASAALLVSRDDAGSRARVLGLGVGQEPGLPDNDVPLRAEGICAAARGALAEAEVSMADMAIRVSDAAGDSYAFKEQALMLSRLLRTPRERLDLLLPANTLGDVGAAAGLAGLVLAIGSLGRRAEATDNDTGIVFAGSRDGARSAVVVRATCAAREA